MNEVSKWISAGAEVTDGLRLLSVYAPNEHLAALIARAPERFKHLLISALSKFADIHPAVDVQTSQKSARSFREQWPFLADADCPIELKALAADKITAYNEYCALHEKLFNCTSTEESFDTANNLLEKYRQNLQITAEFAYYKEHGHILGKHPVFKENQKLKLYRKMNPYQLAQEQRRLAGSIWRINSEIKKGNKPHLQDSREASRAKKERELAVVNNLIEEFNQAK